MSARNLRTRKNNDMPVTKGDFLALKSDLVELKNGFLAFKDTVALKSDLAAFKNIVALKSDLSEIKDTMALKSDLSAIKDAMALKSDLVMLKSDILANTKAAIDELTVIVGNSFTRMEKSVDQRFEELKDSMDDQFEGVNNRIQGLWSAFDSHTLDCVRRDEHDRLEKRVRVLETA